jgi:hypothetical protein
MKTVLKADTRPSDELDLAELKREAAKLASESQQAAARQTGGGK